MNNEHSYKNKRYSSRNRNRRFNRYRGGYSQKISHSRYISKPEVTEVEEYAPTNNFKDFGIHHRLLANIIDRGYKIPTKIQDQAIPLIMLGKDVLGLGNTGSGKTGAFLIPMINKVLTEEGNRVLILTPTRELAAQIQSEFLLFAKNTKARMTLVIGGANIHKQISHLKSGSQFVVATPGRLMDLDKRGCINLRLFNNIVLDEVDQMLDMGFVNDIKYINSKLADKKQALFFSATMSSREESIANTLLKDPTKLDVDKQRTTKNITQDIVKVQSLDHKLDTLHELLVKTEFYKVLVFSRTKRGADQLSLSLRKRGIAVDALHGNKSQSARNKILNNFRQNKIDVLVATDVAARGIDIPNVSHVINYDEPANYNEYIHRIGRTGRAGKTGSALTFVLN